MPAEVASRTIRAGSRLERILASGEFAVTAEIAPPASVDASEIRRHASLYRGTVDACNLTDGQRALVRISSMAAATIALQEGVEPIMQMVSRDRNRIGLQSDLLGAAALGIRNVLCLWGDPPTAGNEKEAKAVYDFFFQAEDGIRDLTVTGVQTCALPISTTTRVPRTSSLRWMNGRKHLSTTRTRTADKAAGGRTSMGGTGSL